MATFEQRLKAGIQREMLDISVPSAPVDHILNGLRFASPKTAPRRVVPWAVTATAFSVLAVVAALALRPVPHVNVPVTPTAETPSGPKAMPFLKNYVAAGPQGNMYSQAVVASSRSGRDVWVAVGSVSKPGISVYRSVDGGKTWNTAKVAVLHDDSPFSLRLDVVNNHDAWILAAGAPAAGQEKWYLFRSTDLGSHWDALPQPASRFVFGDVSGLTMKFTTPKMGWITFNVPIIISGTVVGVERTLDGGQTWASSTIQFQPHWNKVLIEGPVLAASGEWTLTVTDQDPGSHASHTYVSRDNGVTWH